MHIFSQTFNLDSGKWTFQFISWFDEFAFDCPNAQSMPNAYYIYQQFDQNVTCFISMVVNQFDMNFYMNAQATGLI